MDLEVLDSSGTLSSEMSTSQAPVRQHVSQADLR